MAGQGKAKVKFEVRTPEPLDSAHIVGAFDCGVGELDLWLKRRALANQLSGATRCFVAVDPAQRVLAYYALAAGAVAREGTSAAVRHNMPDPVPVIVLARLAVDRSQQGRHLGAAMLQDAVRRVVGISRQVGARALLVHALDERAAGFYRRYGFQDSPLQPMTLMLRLPGAKR
jgi:ribosomal protein S18 acetylase RimI-like enzyme